MWFPRGLLLRAAAQKLCLTLLKEWKADATPSDPAAVKQVVAHAVADARLKPDAVRRQIEEEAVRGPDGGPADQIERWLTGLEGQVAGVGRHPDAGAWSRAVWEQARDLIGTRPTGEQDSTVRRSRTAKILDDAVKPRGGDVGERVRRGGPPAGGAARPPARRDRHRPEAAGGGVYRVGDRRRRPRRSRSR